MDVTNQAGKIVVGFDFDAEHFYGTEEALSWTSSSPRGGKPR